MSEARRTASSRAIANGCMAAPAASPSIWDPTDDPTHGQQQFTFFNSHYDSYCYLPDGRAFSPSTTSGTVFGCRVCARVMFPGSCGAIGHFARLLGVWIPRFPERCFRVRLDGGFRRRRFWSFRPPASCGICREPGPPMRVGSFWPSRPCVPFAPVQEKWKTEHVYGEFRYKTKKTLDSTSVASFIRRKSLGIPPRSEG